MIDITERQFLAINVFLLTVIAVLFKSSSSVLINLLALIITGLSTVLIFFIKIEANTLKSQGRKRKLIFGSILTSVSTVFLLLSWLNLDWLHWYGLIWSMALLFVSVILASFSKPEKPTGIW